MKLTEREIKIYISGFTRGYDVCTQDVIDKVSQDITAYKTAVWCLLDDIEYDEVENNISEVQIPPDLLTINHNAEYSKERIEAQLMVIQNSDKT